MKRIKNTYLKLSLYAFISLLAGLQMLFTPEQTPTLVIMGVGFIWTMEGISYIFEIIAKYFREKK